MLKSEVHDVFKKQSEFRRKLKEAEHQSTPKG